VTKVIHTKLGNKTARAITGKQTSVERRFVRDSANGKMIVMRTLDAGSRTFDTDLTYVFGKNVARARRENKQITGSTDSVPTKR
jgi:hypothetical protein